MQHSNGTNQDQCRIFHDIKEADNQNCNLNFSFQRIQWESALSTPHKPYVLPLHGFICQIHFDPTKDFLQRKNGTNFMVFFAHKAFDISSKMLLLVNKSRYVFFPFRQIGFGEGMRTDPWVTNRPAGVWPTRTTNRDEARCRPYWREWWRKPSVSIWKWVSQIKVYP